MFILLITGCQSRPVILEKPISYPSQTRSGVKYIPSEADLSCLAWWEKLHNPRLNQLIRDALAHNNDIQAAKATILQAEAQLKSAHLAWLPTLDASAQGFTGGTWNTSVAPEGRLASTGIFSNLSQLRFRGYYAGFVPGYSVNIMNNIYQVKAAAASLEIKNAETQATNLSIISQMAGSYFMLLSQRAQLGLEKQLVRDLKALHHLEHIRYNSGATDIQRVT